MRYTELIERQLTPLDPSKMRTALDRFLTRRGVPHTIVYLPDAMLFKIEMPDRNDEADNLLKRNERGLLRRGWFITHIKRGEEYGDIIAEVYVEPLVGHAVQPPDTLYHATPAEHLKSVLKHGLMPQRGFHTGQMTQTPPRVYVAIDMKTARYIANRLKKDDPISREYAILVIDRTKLAPDVRFYRDPQLPGGIYTTITIPASALHLA